jgi:hypothetical protein
MIGWLVVLRIASPADICYPILHFAPLLRYPVCPFSVNERRTRHVAAKKCYVWLAWVLSRTVAGLLGPATGGSTWRLGNLAIVAEGKHALAGRLARASGAPRRCTAMTKAAAPLAWAPRLVLGFPASTRSGISPIAAGFGRSWATPPMEKDPWRALASRHPCPCSSRFC